MQKAESKARILSLVFDFFHRNKWKDLDDFSLRFTDRISPLVNDGYLPASSIKAAAETTTNFFVLNRLSKEKFCNLFLRELTAGLREIGISTQPGALSIHDVFPEIGTVSLEVAQTLLPKLDVGERVIQDTLRNVLREKGATNMVSRKSDTSLEVADLEDFTLKVIGRPLSFTGVVKGYRSVGKRVRLQDIMHQIIKAYNGTLPDYIILVLAKDPVDGVITNLVSYARNSGNRDLIVTMDPIDTVRFLRAHQVV